MRRKYSFKPTGLIGVNAELLEPFLPSQVGTMKYQNANYTLNMRAFQGSSKKRFGATASIASVGEPVLNVIRVLSKDGTNDKTVILTPTNMGIMNTNWTSFLYRTEMIIYTDSVADITGKVVTFKAGTTIDTDGALAGDYFILDDDWGTSDPDTNWGVIDTIDSETQCTLVSNYPGTTGAWGGSEKTGYIRQVFTAPDSPITNTYYSWSWAIVDDKLCFTNPNHRVQYYSFATGYSISLDSTEAVNFKFCIDYANRLILANTAETASEDPLEIKWSKENDPTDWTDTTAGNLTLQTSEMEITGLGKMGNYLVVFTPHSLIFGSRTGISTSPIIFPDERKGVGAWASDSIVHADGTVFFMGQNDFYKLDGTYPMSIGQPIRDEVFANISSNDLRAMKGLHSPTTNEIWWFMPLTRYVYAYDYIRKAWNYYAFSNDANGYLSGGGVTKASNTSYTEELFLGQTAAAIATPKLNHLDSGGTADNTTAITASYRTRMTDFSDQDQEALGMWKTVHRVRVHYKDLTADTPLALYLYKDGAIVSLGTNTVGAGAGGLATTDWYTTSAGNFFEFRIYESSTTKKIQILGIEVFYELGGVYYPL